MQRVPLCELRLAVTVEGLDTYHVSWTLRARSEYPPRPGRPSRWSVLGEYASELRIEDDELRVAILQRAVRPLADRLFVRGAREFVDRLVEERARGSWVRVAIELAEPPGFTWRMIVLPWEEIFERFDLLVVRRYDFEAEPALEREPLAFPLRLCRLVLAPDGGPRLDAHVQSSVELGALELCPPESPVIDIVHLAYERPWSWRWPWSLAPASREALRKARLVVLHERGVSHASHEHAADLLTVANAQAVLAVTGPEEAVAAIHRDLLHDRPLDVCLRDLRARGASGVLHTRSEAELCVSLSSLLGDALGAEPELPVESTGTMRSPLARAWSAALRRPLEEVAAVASSLTIEHELDLEAAVRAAREARALRAERPAARRVLQQLAQRTPAAVETASSRVTELHVLEPATSAPVDPAAALDVDRPYALRARIVRAPDGRSWAADLFPEQALRETLARLGVVELTVTFHADTEVARLSSDRGRLRLPAIGDSTPATVELTVLRPGPFAVRACLYHGTALLQSVLLEGTAGSAEAPAPLASRLDYRASDHLMLLEEHEQPDATIWTNEATTGTHWFGVFTGDGDPEARAADGLLSPLSTAALARTTKQLHDALYRVQLLEPPDGEEVRLYRFDPPGPATAEERDARAAQLAALARAGWEAYTTLFNRPAELSPARSTRRGLLAIASCRPERTAVPWAALYDYHLDVERPVLCEIATAELPDNRDLLADPAACRARVECPLAQPARASRTVCPFGFWGIRHRIEQPLLHLRPQRLPAAQPLELDAAPDDARLALSHEQLKNEVRLKTEIAAGAAPPRIAIAWWPHFDQRVAAHLERVARLGTSAVESARPDILTLLADKRRHVYYFFCHGDVARDAFRLLVGPGRHGDAIGPADLNHERYDRARDDLPPVVFLNGCDTMAFRSDTINTLLERLRGMGASGVIGTEIPVHSYLAEDVGRRVLEGFVAGAPLGEAFLAMRRGLLREQLNPLGLAYTAYASARLHLCGGDECRECVRRAAR